MVLPPQEPGAILALRIVQLIFALIVLGISAFLVSQGMGLFPAHNFGLANVGGFIYALHQPSEDFAKTKQGVLTLLFTIFCLVTRCVPTLNNQIFIIIKIIGDGLFAIFWLSCMGVNASYAAAWTVGNYYYKRSYSYYYGYDYYYALTASLAGISALELYVHSTGN
jgi:hypothetical protein